MFSTIYDWSIEHIRDVFEAKSEDECLFAIDHTFSQSIEVIVNGNPLTRLELERFVLSMLKNSNFRLNVQWQHALEVPQDSTNRNGVLGGYYIIRNVRKQAQGVSPNARFTRHKYVHAHIESESSDQRVDSRRIVKLYLAAEDKPASS
ncbi:hypothetical protein ABKN59_010964 [Abortiporus biennis]